MHWSWYQPVVRRGRSISDHRRPSTSPRRHPVRIISHVAAMAWLPDFRCQTSVDLVRKPRSLFRRHSAMLTVNRTEKEFKND
jgi:hypothetical protein